MTKVLTQACISVARQLPRGGWRLVRWAARRDPAIQCVYCQVRGVPRPVYLDCRDKGCVRFFLTGDGGGSRGVRALLPRLLRRGDFFLDVGANYGMVSMVAAEAVGAEGRVVAVEALSTVADVLSRTFADHPNVKVLPVAISETTGTVEFFQTEGSVLSGLSEKIGGRMLRVPSRRLSDVVQEEGQPTVLKVDVEGSEVQSFNSAADTLSGQNCPIVIFEALSEQELMDSKAAISRMHGGSGTFHRISRAGALRRLELPKNTSDCVYVPDHLSERVRGLMEA